jgi:hypothetical protein
VKSKESATQPSHALSTNAITPGVKRTRTNPSNHKRFEGKRGTIQIGAHQRHVLSKIEGKEVKLSINPARTFAFKSDDKPPNLHWNTLNSSLFLSSVTGFRKEFSLCQNHESVNFYIVTYLSSEKAIIQSRTKRTLICVWKL